MCQSLKKVSCLSLRHSQECLRQDFEVLRASQGPLLNKPSLPVVPSLTGVLTKLPLRVRTPDPPPSVELLSLFFAGKKGHYVRRWGGPWVRRTPAEPRPAAEGPPSSLPAREKKGHRDRRDKSELNPAPYRHGGVILRGSGPPLSVAEEGGVPGGPGGVTALGARPGGG